MPYPTDFKYTKEHEWIKADGKNATIGITDHAQESLGDIVFVDLPKLGSEITAGKTFGSVESVKAVSDLYAPASGTVTELNGELATAPEKINQDAHASWMIKITLKDPNELNGLLSAADYEKFVAEEGGQKDRRFSIAYIRLKDLLTQHEIPAIFIGLPSVTSILISMRYLPKSPADRVAMLQIIGARSIDDLFAPIPAEYRLERDLKVPRQMAESEIVDWFRERSRENGDGYTSFLGAGAYSHYRPVIIDSLISRGEFLTAYTPYQAEISQGTLQSIFEFQSMICELTGMEVANASMYDGSTASTEAAMMAVRLTGRRSIVVARECPSGISRSACNLRTQSGSAAVNELSFGENGRIDLVALDKQMTAETACLLIQSPNFFGTIEDIAAAAEIAHNHGALLVVSIAEAVSLGIVEPPRQADIIAMEAQSFGVPLGFWRPILRCDCDARAICAANARTAGGPNDR